MDNEEWQRFRLSLKGLPTAEKLVRLQKYYHDNIKLRHGGLDWDQDVWIRLDNYLKALARGGQIAVTDDYMTDLIQDRLVIRK